MRMQWKGKAAGKVLRALGLLTACGAIGTLPAAGGDHRQSDAIWIGPWEGLWSEAHNWSGGIVPNSPSCDVYIDSDGDTASSVMVNIDPEVGNLSIDAGDMLTIMDGRFLFPAGDVVNNGVLNLASSGNYAYFDPFGSPSSLGGTGELVMSDHPYNYITSRYGDRIIHRSGHTIRGGGRIVGARFTNEGLIQADVSTALTIDLLGGKLHEENYNCGIMQATNGATLILQDTLLDNAGGLIEALEGSFVSLLDDTAIGNGMLATQGTGMIRVSGSSVRFRDLQLVGAMTIEDDAECCIEGVITNADVISVDSNGSETYLMVSEHDAVLTGPGKVVLNDHVNNLVVRERDYPRLTNTGGHLIRGGGTFGDGRLYFTNDSVVQADMTTPLRLAFPVTEDPANRNRGILQAVDGGTLVMGYCYLDNHDGVIRALDRSRVEFDSSNTTICGGVLDTEGTGVIASTNWGADVPILRDVTNLGNIAIGNLASLKIQGTLTNHGTILLDAEIEKSYLNMASEEVTLAGSGEIVLGDGDHNYISTHGLDMCHVTHGPSHTIRGGGKLSGQGRPLGMTNQGSIVAQGPYAMGLGMSGYGAIFINEGLLHVTSGAQMNVSNGEMRGSVMVDEGGTMYFGNRYRQFSGCTIVDGLLTINTNYSPEVDLMAGVFGGNGTVEGYVENSGCTFAPGNPVGTLTIDDDCDIQPCAALSIEVGGYIPGEEHDVLVITGTASLNGVITVELIDDFIPQIGDNFQFLTAGELQGSSGHGCLDLPDLPEGFLAFDRSDPDTLSLVVLAEEPPSTDLTWDNRVDIDDVFAVLAGWGPCDCDCCPGDVNGDQQVDIDDLFTVLANWT